MKVMTTTEAAKRYIELKPKQKAIEAELEVCKVVLLRFFHRPEAPKTFRKLIGYSKTSRKVLDQKKVKEHLGKDLPKYQRDSPIETLTIL